nr:hypothetical protein 16 [bacterium]
MSDVATKKVFRTSAEWMRREQELQERLDGLNQNITEVKQALVTANRMIDAMKGKRQKTGLAGAEVYKQQICGLKELIRGHKDVPPEIADFIKKMG